MCPEKKKFKPDTCGRGIGILITDKLSFSKNIAQSCNIIKNDKMDIFIKLGMMLDYIWWLGSNSEALESVE